jgi:hypothetical protein
MDHDSDSSGHANSELDPGYHADRRTQIPILNQSQIGASRDIGAGSK